MSDENSNFWKFEYFTYLVNGNEKKGAGKVYRKRKKEFILIAYENQILFWYKFGIQWKRTELQPSGHFVSHSTTWTIQTSASNQIKWVN